MLDAVRLGPADDATAVTADQLRDVVDRLIAAGHWRDGDPDILIVADAGYDVTRLAFVLADLPVQLLGRHPLRPGAAATQAAPAARAAPAVRPSTAPSSAWTTRATWPAPQHHTTTETTRYGTARRLQLGPAAPAVDPPHLLDRPRRRPAVIEGTLIRLQVEHLPGDRDPKPVWLWCSATGATAADVDRWWQSFLRRFDLEHTFRLFKQTLGWTRPKIRTPQAADRWTWLIIAAHTQLRLARPLAADLRRPWERPTAPGPAHSRPGPSRVSEPPREDREAVAQLSIFSCQELPLVHQPQWMIMSCRGIQLHLVQPGWPVAVAP